MSESNNRLSSSVTLQLPALSTDVGALVAELLDSGAAALIVDTMSGVIVAHPREAMGERSDTLTADSLAYLINALPIEIIAETTVDLDVFVEWSESNNLPMEGGALYVNPDLKDKITWTRTPVFASPLIERLFVLLCLQSGGSAGFRLLGSTLKPRATNTN
jgi:hypothetical protein